MTLDPQKILEQFGIATLLIIGAAWFFAVRVWPFLVARIERRDIAEIAERKLLADARNLERQSLIDALNKITLAHAEESKAIAGEIYKIADQSRQNTVALEGLVSVISRMNGSTKRGDT